jgi:peptide/nickel transport system permease protein
VRYLGGVVQGDFGRSIVFNRPAWDVVAERIPATFELGVPALIVSIVLGIPLGIICARRRNSAFDRVIMSLSLAGQSMPAFFIGILLILFFGVQLRALPTFGRDTAAHLILPTVTLMVYPLAFIIRLTRSSLLEILSEPFIRTANAKGLSGQRVLYIHALRNALIPVLTVVGLQVAAIISGAAIIETVFAWPGIGLLAAQSIGARDYPVIQTVVIFSALAFGLTNMSVDLLYTTLDPRIRAEGGR